VKPQIIPAESISIPVALDVLKKGQVLAIPTETVYGLAADASNEHALKKIFRLKNRPENHPLIVHIAVQENSNLELLTKQLSIWSRDVPPEAIQIAQKFWPGPLTLILKKARHVSDLITGKQDTIGIRAPSHPWTMELLKAFGSGLAAPSANRFGRISPTHASHVYQEFENENLLEPLLIMDGGSCEVGIESTILDLSRVHEQGPIILRPGMITTEQIHACLDRDVTTQLHSDIRHSGGMLGHYAPSTLLEMKSVFDLTDEDFQIGSVLVASFTSVHDLKIKWPNSDIQWHQLERNPQTIARELYALLRQFDHTNCQKIIFDAIPLDTQWIGIRDRLTRSVYGSGKVS
jgi:L-threonylcarbamoyladenylate synthase